MGFPTSFEVSESIGIHETLTTSGLIDIFAERLEFASARVERLSPTELHFTVDRLSRLSDLIIPRDDTGFAMISSGSIEAREVDGVIQVSGTTRVSGWPVALYGALTFAAAGFVVTNPLGRLALSALLAVMGVVNPYLGAKKAYTR